MSKLKTHERCCAHAYSAVIGLHQCSRRGSVSEGGKLYCKQHAPSAVAARLAVREAVVAQRVQRAHHVGTRRYLGRLAFDAIAEGREISPELAARIRACARE